jgi:2-polyprenyl-3-methyl-5-hydroxy-6-metoxy-1,4-benzoquinol methylase
MYTYLKTKDYFLTQEEFELKYDPAFEMLITHPQPNNLSKYYQSTSYISHTDDNDTFIDKIYHYIKKYSLRKKVQLINSLDVPTKTVLDIGAGTGDFLLEASKQNWLTNGVEPNEQARTKAHSKGIPLETSLTKIQEKQHVITLWHVLEHLPKLEQQIIDITNILESGGYLIIAVPNYKSHDAKKYKTHWAAYDTPRHLWHFSRTSISLLFEPKGYTVKKTLPMCFDSFYVSLLSEKYKHGKAKYMNAFFTGLYSNIKARFNGQYSSLIYILKKD